MGRKKIQISRIGDERNRQAISKKENKALPSPDDTEKHFVLTPRTEEKYNKINQEFEQMMKKNQLHPVKKARPFYSKGLFVNSKSLEIQQQTSTSSDNFQTLPVSVPASSNNISEDGYASQPGTTDSGVMMSSGMPVTSGGRITGEHMNGSYSRVNTPGITDQIYGVPNSPHS
ncbi:Myocyte-specific enhancer factor 2C [Acropora cervicornis]|uniref:Myocyte-specific enhancer factor 2C n=1 Tax=Acropora cervicornis TaxID=6130 RepID=A0AAD9QKF0_ACRCE|nr:Myocyte-specific enhancer factor 2C [Acropora cervicornis]